MDIRCQWNTLGNFSESFTEEDGGHRLWEEGAFAGYKFFLPCLKSLCRLKGFFCLCSSVCFLIWSIHHLQEVVYVKFKVELV